MKERPILFSTPMVRAILEGRKNQTRRIIKPQPIHQLMPCGTGKKYWAYNPTDLKADYFHHNYGEIGDILWVRETWTVKPIITPEQDWKTYLYRASDSIDGYLIKWKPSIFMPKEACRIRLEVTDVRVQRIQEISEEDAIAEGIGIMPEGYGLTPYRNYLGEGGFVGARTSYQTLWESINGKDSWIKNPWCWVIEFKRI